MRIPSITDTEADEWIAAMSPDDIRRIVQEWHAVKQGLCARVLCVPTGTPDWVSRAIDAAMRLDRAEGALRKLMHATEHAVADARQDVRSTNCRNCRGTGRTVDEKSCSLCVGTGLKGM